MARFYVRYLSNYFRPIILITFNYWVDSKTIIRVTPSQISYRSPFRRFLQNWDQISDIKVLHAGHSWRVFINGKETFFSIRVGTELTSETKPERILELPHGDRLLRLICGMANLSEIEKIGESWRCRRTPRASDHWSFNYSKRLYSIWFYVLLSVWW
ncbi:MAG: hypothetical protein A2Z14_02965 [Chloroflexi bacterium RBG_16_48_8]|nr:MAG: hypothetical protein A2Z14_02965 [Chloroflexi bacterium RBG_16_48_8]